MAKYGEAEYGASKYGSDEHPVGHSAGGIVAAPRAFATATGVDIATFYAQYPALVETIVAAGDVDQRERLEGYLKKPFQSPVDESSEIHDTEFGHLVAAAAEFAVGMRHMAEEHLRQQYIDTARYNGLDEIGYFVGIPRRTGEDDTSYRARLKAGFRGLLGGATLEQVIETTATLLDCNVDEIEITEPFAFDSARMDVSVPEYVIEEAPTTTGALIELLYLYKAAGVEITLAQGDAFEYRSLQDYYDNQNILEKSYNVAGYRGYPTASE